MAYPCVLGGGECDGCQRCQNQEKKVCPICGHDDVSKYYVNYYTSDVVGCDECMREVRDLEEL
jgi:hypothetical protein